MAILNVGSGQQFARLADAIAASRDGDVIRAQAGTYVNDFATISTRVTIEGVGGMVNLVATQDAPNGKAILTTTTDVTLDHVSLSGATAGAGNGAGIRHENGALTLNNVYIHHNQNGILAGDNPNSSITVSNSEFAFNGTGTGQTHGLYANQIGSLTIRNSYFHDTPVGHEIKSRAYNTLIETSRVMSGANGTDSYAVDLPNGGAVVLRNNVIVEGAQSQNPNTIHYGGEAGPHPGSSMLISGNTFINDRGNANLFLNQTGVTATLSNNRTFGYRADQISQGPANVSGTNFLSSRPAIDVSQLSFDVANLPELAPAPAPAPVASTGPDTLVVNLSEDAYQGNAQFVVSVDGVELGGAQEVTALHGSGQSQAFTFRGSFGSGAHTVGVRFLNDAYDGSPALDRNLYVDGITFNGQDFADGKVPLYSETLRNFSVTSAISPAAPVETPAPAPETLPAPAPVPVPAPSTNFPSLTMQNSGSAALAARLLTFGQGFAQGQVAAGRQLVAEIDGHKVAVQMDVISTYADGSARMTVLTMLQPALAANTSAQVSLTATVGSAGGAVDLAGMLSDDYAFTVDLNVTEGVEGPKTYHFDAVSLLRQALADGKVSYWMKGAQATEGRIDIPVEGSLHLTFDIRRYADGTTRTDVQFNNDLAMTESGGRVTYDATISQNGAVVFQQASMNHAQYRTWHHEVWSNGQPGVNLQHDVPALSKAGLIVNYDLSTGIRPSIVSNEVRDLASPSFNPLGSGGITTYFPGTGGRADIGPQPMWNTAWLMTQSEGAAKYALAQADAGGSVPWHFVDPDGTNVTTADHPQLWIDYRGGQWGTKALTQQPDSEPWGLDTAHQPDMSYIPYLLTGNRYYLDQLNAQSSFDALSYNPSYRGQDKGITDAWTQTRSRAWDLRQYIEAATANPDGSEMGDYFKGLVTNNIEVLIADLKYQRTWAGEIAGYNAFGNSEIASWMDDFLVITLGQAAGMGFEGAKEALLLKANFTSGQFLAGDKGFNPLDGANYRMVVADAQLKPYTTWAQAWQASKEAGFAGSTPEGTWYQSTAYTHGALAANASIFTHTGSTDALKAYGYLKSVVPPGYADNLRGDDAMFNIVPRLSNGELLTQDHIQITRSTVGGDLTAAKPSSMLYETGSEAMTLRSGGGVGILFAGTGNTHLVGTAEPDYLFGGKGNDIIEGGAGANFLDGGKGADTFVLAWTDVAQDVITGFLPGADHLKLIGTIPDTFDLNSVIRDVTMDAAGNAVLHIGSQHEVTLQGVGADQISQGLFA